MGLNGRLDKLEHRFGSGQCRRCGLFPGSPEAYRFGMHREDCGSGPVACKACRLATLEPCTACGGPELRVLELVVVPGRGERAEGHRGRPA